MRARRNHHGRTRPIIGTLSLLALFLVIPHPAAAQLLPSANATGQDDEQPPFNVVTRTWGGAEFWSDEVIRHGWRIQKNMFSGHYRLLDQNDDRQAWGTEQQCQAALDAVAQREGWPASRGRVIFVLHGLGSFRGRMQRLIDSLAALPETEVYGVGYPSLLADIDSHAAQLARVVAGFPEAQEINFVGHSLGNIVVRRMLAMQMEAAADRKQDARIKRIVMIVPPNHGSSRAAAWANNVLFKTVMGETGQQLGARWAEIAPRLATPQCEFGIIAGARGDENGWSTSIPGDDDGTISVTTTRLVGACDFVTVPVRHTLSESNGDVLSMTARFLQEGHFVSAEKKCPIQDWQLEAGVQEK